MELELGGGVGARGWGWSHGLGVELEPGVRGGIGGRG